MYMYKNVEYYNSMFYIKTNLQNNNHKNYFITIYVLTP